MKQPLQVFILLVFNLLPVAAAKAQTAPPPPEMRIYTNEDGIKLRAVLIGVEKDGNVVLKLESGTLHLVKLAHLSAADQAYLKAYGADVQTVAPATASKTPASALTLTPAPPDDDGPQTLKQALREWSWTWTGPQSNTLVTFQSGGRLVTQEKKISQWEIINDNTVRVTTSGMRSVILLAFNKDLSRFVQTGVSTAPIAGVRGKRVPMYLPRPIARFTFDGADSEPGADIRNVQKHDGLLDLAGIYEYHDKKNTGERVILSVPELDYQAFTVAVHLRPDDIREEHAALLGSSKAGRWLGLNVSPVGALWLYLDNGRSGCPVPGVTIKSGEWTTLAVSCDLKASRLSVYVNGKVAAKLALPKGYKFEVLDDGSGQSHKEWTFVDYGSGRTFKGLVNELVVYNRVLLDVQVENLKFNARLPNKTP